MVRALVVASGVIALAGCTDATGPKLPLAERFDAPAQYRSWWRDVEVCSGRTARLDAVAFYRVVPTPGRDSLHFSDPESGEYRDGAWVRRWNAIYLAAGQVTNPGLVRHEMLHALLRDVGHPPAYFAQRCARLVDY